MNVRKNKTDYPVLILGLIVAIAVVVMIISLCTSGKEEEIEFTPPAFDSGAIAGIPEVPENSGYSELYQDGMAYRFSICGVVRLEGNDALVYLTNPEENEVWLKLRVYDSEGVLLGESGLIKPGEYIKSVELSKELEAGSAVKLKVMGYEPDIYTSAGSVSLNTVIGGESQ